MGKRRAIQGEPKEIMYFFIQNFEQAADGDEMLRERIGEALLAIGVKILEYDTTGGSLGIINESEREGTVADVYKIFDSLGLQSRYLRSEFV